MRGKAILLLGLIFSPSPLVYADGGGAAAAPAGGGAAAGAPTGAQSSNSQLPFWSYLTSSVTYGGGGNIVHPLVDAVYAEAFLMHVLFTSENLLAEAGRIDAMSQHQCMDNFRRFLQTAALSTDFALFRKQQLQVISLMRNLGNAIRYLDDLKLGNLHPKTIKALEYILKTAIPAAESTKLQFQDIPKFPASNFVPPSRNQRPVGFAGGKLIDFFKFLKDRSFSLRFSSEAHLALLEILSPFYQFTAATITQHLTAMDERRNEIFRRWRVEFPERDEVSPAPDEHIE